MRRQTKPVTVTLLNGIGMEIATLTLAPGERTRAGIAWTENYRDIDGELLERDRQIPFSLRLES